MKYVKMPRLRPADRPLQYAPDTQLRRIESERHVPHPAHLSIR